jgi:hypothetical protein
MIPNFKAQCITCGSKSVAPVIFKGKKVTKLIECSNKDPQKDGLKKFPVYNCKSCKKNYPIPF